MWFCDNEEIKSHDDIDENIQYLVYCIHYESGKKYIGKKVIRGIRRVKPTKEQLKIRKNYVRKEMKNVPFLKYRGSSKDIDPKDSVTYIEVLHFCETKKEATYFETKELFCNDVLFSDGFYNKNILGKFFPRDVLGVEDG